MATVCVFCGEALSLLNRKDLFCCTTTQPACRDCHAELGRLSQKERGRRALATGRAAAPEVIRSVLDAREEEARARVLARHQAEQDRIRDRICPHCGVPMRKMGRHQFQLGEHDLLWGDLKHLMAGSLTLDVLYCEQCRKVEFFLPEDMDGPSGKY